MSAPVVATAAEWSAEFALIGHQESWSRIASVLRSLRDPALPPVPEAELRLIAPAIPPRTVMRTCISSVRTGRETNGVYVETFITPEELEAGSFHRAIAKVREAVAAAAREGARVAALGGFTSIVIEGRPDAVSTSHGPALTTGNSLTAAFVVQGVERAAASLGIDLREATVAILGATGDVGSACSRHLGRRTKRLLLAARNQERLRREELAHRREGIDAEASPDATAALRRADVVIAAASLAQPEFDLGACRPDALVCDAGYPKNLRVPPGAGAKHVFWGGMGQVIGGWRQRGGLPLEAYYAFPVQHVAHGCLLEAVALAMARRFEPFSQGRGLITPERMDEIAGVAATHGIVLAPLFGPDGLWEPRSREEGATG